MRDAAVQPDPRPQPTVRAHATHPLGQPRRDSAQDTEVSQISSLVNHSLGNSKQHKLQDPEVILYSYALVVSLTSSVANHSLRA